MINQSRIVINVRIQPFFLQHIVGNFCLNFKEIHIAGTFGHFFRNRTQKLRTRISVLVDSVTETHHLSSALERIFYVINRIHVMIVNFFKHFKNAFVRSTVKRSFQCANSGRQTWIIICKSRSHDSCRESRCIEFMISLKNHDGWKHLGQFFIRPFTGQHVQEVFNDAHLLINVNQRLVVSDSDDCRNDRQHLRQNARRFIVLHVVSSPKQWSRRAQDTHRMLRFAGNIQQKPNGFCRQNHLANKHLAKLLQFLFVWQTSVPQ